MWKGHAAIAAFGVACANAPEAACTIKGDRSTVGQAFSLPRSLKLTTYDGL
jgi:hypothetical protein